MHQRLFSELTCFFIYFHSKKFICFLFLLSSITFENENLLLTDSCQMPTFQKSNLSNAFFLHLMLVVFLTLSLLSYSHDPPSLSNTSNTFLFSVSLDCTYSLSLSLSLSLSHTHTQLSICLNQFLTHSLSVFLRHSLSRVLITPSQKSVSFLTKKACREKVRGLQSKMTAFNERIKLLNQRGTPLDEFQLEWWWWLSISIF